MSHQPRSWWSRLIGTFRRAGRPADQAALPPVGDDGLLAAMPDQQDREPPDSERRTGPIARWARRDQALQNLLEGYDRILGLVDSVQNHLHIQQARTEQLVDAVRQLNTTMQDFPAQTRQQVDLMGSIASQLQSTNVQTARLAEAVGQLPNSLQAQSEVLDAIKQQLGMSNETTAQLANSLADLGTSLGALNHLSQAQSEGLKRLASDAEHRDRSLTQSLRLQARRLLTVLIVAIVIGLAGLAAGTVAIYLRLPG